MPPTKSTASSMTAAIGSMICNRIGQRIVAVPKESSLLAVILRPPQVTSNQGRLSAIGTRNQRSSCLEPLCQEHRRKNQRENDQSPHRPGVAYTHGGVQHDD